MNDNPLPLLMIIAMGAFFARTWWLEMQGVRAARPAGARACVIAAAGALGILALETGGELALGLAEEQSRMTALFAAYTLVAAFVEELIFRGYVGDWVARRGRAGRAAAVCAASLIFAAIHPFLWSWEDGALVATLTPKAWLSFGAVFAASLWFYHCRFAGWNPSRSLLPCIIAHLAKNLGVIAIKGAQGFLVGWW